MKENSPAELVAVFLLASITGFSYFILMALSSALDKFDQIIELLKALQ